VRDSDRERLRAPYSAPVEPVPDDRRLDDRLGPGIGHIIDLGELVVSDLDPAVGGIGWWAAYSKVPRQERILISDYLLSAAHSVSTNIAESYVHWLELGHAVEDFRDWIERNTASSQPVLVPESLYDDLAFVRIQANLAAVFRALASALDCLGACVVGVGGLPLPIVTTDLAKVMEYLNGKNAGQSPRFQQLVRDLSDAESAAGPTGWVTWLLAMRHMLVHRGRLSITCSITTGPGGIEGLNLTLPKSPELTEIQGWVYAGGRIAGSFESDADAIIRSLMHSTCSYLHAAGLKLSEIWQERSINPPMILQPTEQWREGKGLVNPNASFNGYALGPPAGASSDVRELDVSTEIGVRMRAAGITRHQANDILPSPEFWS
jgi:hypothetical protein